MHVRSMAAVLVGGLVVSSTAAAAENEVGKKIFGQRCVGCHGADGKGNAKMAEMLKVKIPDLAAASGKSDAELLKLLSDGKLPMPSFGKSLSKEEMAAVLDYAKRLANGTK